MLKCQISNSLIFKRRYTSVPNSVVDYTEMTKVTLKIPDTKIITIILRSAQLSIQSVLRIAGAMVRRIQAHLASQLSFSTLIPGFFTFQG